MKIAIEAVVIRGNGGNGTLRIAAVSAHLTARLGRISIWTLLKRV